MDQYTRESNTTRTNGLGVNRIKNPWVWILTILATALVIGAIVYSNWLPDASRDVNGDRRSSEVQESENSGTAH